MTVIIINASRDSLHIWTQLYPKKKLFLSGISHVFVVEACDNVLSFVYHKISFIQALAVVGFFLAPSQCED